MYCDQRKGRTRREKKGNTGEQWRMIARTHRRQAAQVDDQIEPSQQSKAHEQASRREPARPPAHAPCATHARWMQSTGPPRGSLSRDPAAEVHGVQPCQMGARYDTLYVWPRQQSSAAADARPLCAKQPPSPAHESQASLIPTARPAALYVNPYYLTRSVRRPSLGRGPRWAQEESISPRASRTAGSGQCIAHGYTHAEEGAG